LSFEIGAWKTSTTVDPMLKAPNWSNKRKKELSYAKCIENS